MLPKLLPGPLRRLASLLLLGLAAACGDSGAGPLAPELPRPGAPSQHPDHALFLQAARDAWGYVEREYHPETGWISPVEGYPYATAWDLASGLAALYCAGELGLIPRAEAEARLERALLTLGSALLYEGVAFNKTYDVRTAVPSGPPDRVEEFLARGYGWSATDLGRLLIWLRILSENQPRLRPHVDRIVDRLDFSRLAAGGYLQGADSRDGSLREYQEGRVGYEQYAAYGFALWRRRAERALRLHENTLPVAVMGVPLVADRRGHDVLTSEPFVLAGLEVGWNPEMRDLSRRVLQVQEERHRRTGQVTMVSEDGVPEPPHYFYYYSINWHGASFVVLSSDHDEVLDWPRWVSTKAAYAWHALLPGDYTRLAVSAVQAARDPAAGWAAGVFEGASQASTGGRNLNTAAVVLEAALYSATRRPLVYGGT